MRCKPWKLKFKTDNAHYIKRKSTVEPVYGIIKNVLGLRQFSLRGLEAVSDERKLVAIPPSPHRKKPLVRQAPRESSYSRTY